MRIISTRPLTAGGYSGKKNTGKYLVNLYINDTELTIALYAGELRRFKLEEGAELPDSTFTHIEEKVLLPRAKNRCEYLLTRKSYTVRELRTKLEDGFYTSHVIEKTIDFLTEYGFVDDENYARQYIEAFKDKKSQRNIQMSLLQKGISADLIKDLFYELSLVDTGALSRICDKRLKKSDLSDSKEYNRQMRYLLSKGFSYDDIKHELGKRKNLS